MVRINKQQHQQEQPQQIFLADDASKMYLTPDEHCAKHNL